MRGRMGMALVVSVALLIASTGGGCSHRTPEQRAQDRLAKQQAAEAKAQAKAQQKQAQAQTKAQADAARAQADAAKKQADADRKAAAQASKQADVQAKADAKRAADEKKRQDAMAKDQARQAEAQAKADKKAAEMKAAEDKKAADLAAKDQKKQAAMLAKADKKKPAAAAPAAVAEAPLSADTGRAKEVEALGPVINEDPADTMTLATRQGYGKHPDDTKKVIGYPYFTPENHQRLFDQHVQTMAAEGQAADATLSDADFDGGELNATGRANLALALQSARANNKLTLYVGTTHGNDEMTGDRAAAIERYIKASPWSSVAVTTKQGLNATNTTSVLPGINALKRMDKEAGGSGNAGMSSGGDTTGGRSRLGSGSSGSSSSGQ